MGKTDEKIQEYSPFKIGGIFSVIGILFLVIVYGAVTNAECSQVKKNAEDNTAVCAFTVPQIR